MTIALTSQGRAALKQNRFVLLSETVSGSGGIVFGDFNLLSHPLTTQTGDIIYVMGNYTGSAPAQPTASWSSGDTPTISHWQAENGWWECLLTTPETATGDLILSIGSQNSQPIAVAQGVDDLGPGLFISPILIWGVDNGAYDDAGFIRIGTYFVRGMVGEPQFTLTDTVEGSGDAANFAIDTLRNAITDTFAIWQSTTAQWQITLTATDGITTFSQDITVLNPQTGIPFFATWNTTLYDTDRHLYDGNTIQFGTAGFWPETIHINTGHITNVDDPANLITWDSGDQVFVIQASDATKYGAYPITVTMTDNAGVNTYTYTITFYILHRQPPNISWRPAFKVFDNTPAMAKIGTISYAVDDYLRDIYTKPVQTVPLPTAYISVFGDVFLREQPSVGSVVLNMQINSSVGSTNLRIVIPVNQGTLLPESAITYTPLPDPLDNSMARPSIPAAAGFSTAQPLLLTTMSVTGFTNTPTWTIEVKTASGNPDNCQILGFAPNASWCPPRYTFNGPLYTGGGSAGDVPQFTATGTEGITLYASYLSAQTDNVYITADDGEGTRCTLLLSVVVAEKVGPNIDCGPGLTYVSGVSYPTVNQLMAEWYANPAAFDGAVVTLHPGIDPVHDLNYSAHPTASGYLNGWWPGPATLQSPPGTVRTVLDYNGLNNGSQPEAGIVCNNFDLTIINLEVCNCSAVGEQGEPNAGGLYMNGGLPGNFTIRGCYVHNCDNGIMNGDQSGRHVLIEDSIFERCGCDYGTGQDHNIYVSTISSFTFRNSISDASLDDHLVKSRAMVTTIDNCFLRQGAQAVSGGVPIDCPLCGIIQVTDTVIINSSNPGNNGQITEFGEEINTALTLNGWNISSVLFNNNTIYNIAAPQAVNNGNSAANGLCLHSGRTVLTGLPITMTYSNNKFYNLEQSQWLGPGVYSGFASYYVADMNVNDIDGGGNVAITEYTPQFVIDPLTGQVPVDKPLYYLGHINSTGFCRQALVTHDALQLDFVIDTAPAIGTVIATLEPNWNTVALTNPTFTMQSVWQSNGTRSPISLASSTFAMSSSGVLTVNASDLADGLYYLNIIATGLDANSSSQTINQWVPIVIGTGHVPAA